MYESDIQQVVMPPSPPPMPIKKVIKRTSNYMVGGLLIYEAFMIISSILYFVVAMFYKIITQYGHKDLEEVISELSINLEKSGTPYLLAILFGLPLIFLYYQSIRPTKIKQLFVSNTKMDKRIFLMFFIVCMSGQAIFSLIGGGLEALFNLLGLSIMKALEQVPQSSSISMILYISFLGPITEELLFRGILLRRLEKFGKVFAIVVSSVLFGAFHGNLAQGLFATFMGLIFAYVAIEYSIKWSILLHIINNFVFGELFLLLTGNLSPSIQDNISAVMYGLFLVGAIIIVFRSRKSILEYIRSNKTTKGFYRYAFTSSVMIIFLIVQLLMSILAIRPI